MTTVEKFDSVREQVANILKNGVTAGSIAINNRCNLSCRHCYILEPERKTGFFSSNYRAVTPTLFNKKTACEIALDFKQSGALLLTIPTMEPLLTRESRSGSLAVAKTFVPDDDLERNVVRGMSLITNATLTHLLSDEQVQELSKRIEFLSVSVEGNQEIHDRIRGAGNFERAISGINNLGERGYPLQKITLQCTIQPWINDPYRQTLDVLEIAERTEVGKASFTMYISPQLTFFPTSKDVNHHYKTIAEVLRAFSDAEKKGISNKLLTIYETYESPAGVIALNQHIQGLNGSIENLQYNAFETSYYFKVPEFRSLDVRLEVAPHAVEIPGYPRVAASITKEKKIAIDDSIEPAYQGARMTNCFGYQTDQTAWAHWMPGLIAYLHDKMISSGENLAFSLNMPKDEQKIFVNPDIPRTREEYFTEVLEKAIQIQLFRTLHLNACYEKLAKKTG